MKVKSKDINWCKKHKSEGETLKKMKRPLCKTTKRGFQKSLECPLTLGASLHGTHYRPKHLREKRKSQMDCLEP